MTTKENSTYISSVDQLLKSFVDEKGHIPVDENCDPETVQFLDKKKTIPNKFKLIKADRICPFCGSKLHLHDVDDYTLNDTVGMLKEVYHCYNENCNKYVRPLWEEHIHPDSHYAIDILNKTLKFGLICNISFEKQAEIIKLFTGVKLPRTTLYEYAKANHDNFIAKWNKIIDDAIKEQKIKFSEVLSYDEQHVLTNEGWKYKLMAMDPKSQYIYDFKIVDPSDFDLECIIDFLKPIVDENNIKVLSADDAKLNKKAAKVLNLEFDLCNFHKMANLMKIIRGPIKHLIRSINSEVNKIEKNDKKIHEIKILRKGKPGRVKKGDKEHEKLVKNKRKYERENSESRSKIQKYEAELKSLLDAKDAVSQCINSKTYNGGINRYNRMLNNLDKYHPKTHSFIINLEKNLDFLLMHTKYKDAPTTNNCIELCHRHTLNGYDKRKYKTVEGIEREMNYKKIRWNKRCVLDWT